MSQVENMFNLAIRNARARGMPDERIRVAFDNCLGGSDATQARQEPQDSQPEHPQAEIGGATVETGSFDRSEESGKSTTEMT